jgi:tetratricopeptide (TPR) repeat protein
MPLKTWTFCFNTFFHRADACCLATNGAFACFLSRKRLPERYFLNWQEQLWVAAQQLTYMSAFPAHSWCSFRFVGTCLLLPLLLTSCSTRQSQIQHARQLEQQEQWDDALAAYNRVLPQIQAGRTAELAEIYSHVGRCLIELGKGSDALASLDHALFHNPDSSEAHLRMAQLFIAANAPEKAQAHIDYAAAVHPDDPEMLEVRSDLFAEEDRVDLAERDLLRASQLSKNADRAVERLAQFYINADKPDKARAVLTSGVERSAHKSRLLLMLGRLEETEGNAAAAESSYRKALAVEDSVENNRRLAQFFARNGEIDKAEELLHRVDALGPASTATADLEMQSGQSEAAIRDYESAYKHANGNASLYKTDPSHSQKALSNIAVRLIEADLQAPSSATGHDVTAARRHLEEASRILESDTRHLLQSEIDFVSGDLPSSQREAETALSSDADPASARYMLGIIAQRRGDHVEALKYWQAALEADTQHAPARLALAADAIEQHDGPRAEEYVIDVVRDEPANMNGLLLYAKALVLQHRYDSARALCQRAASVDPTNARVPIVLGDIALDQHQLAMALLEYEKAMLLAPHSKDAIEGLTAVYEKGGTSKAMLRKLERLAQSGTPSSRLMEIAGRLYASQHMYSDAKRCLERAIQMDPDRDSATLALAGAYVDSRSNPAASELLNDAHLRRLGLFNESSSALISALRAEHDRNWSEAVRQYESAVRVGDPTGIASNNLAWLYATEGKHLDRALQLAQHALEANPGSPQILDTLGIIEVQDRQYSQAIAAFRTGIRRTSELHGMAELQHTIEAHLLQTQQLSGQPVSHP